MSCHEIMKIMDMTVTILCNMLFYTRPQSQAIFPQISMFTLRLISILLSCMWWLWQPVASATADSTAQHSTTAAKSQLSAERMQPQAYWVLW